MSEAIAGKWFDTIDVEATAKVQAAKIRWSLESLADAIPEDALRITTPTRDRGLQLAQVGTDPYTNRGRQRFVGDKERKPHGFDPRGVVRLGWMECVIVRADDEMGVASYHEATRG